MQHNTARNINIMHSCLEIVIKSSINFDNNHIKNFIIFHLNLDENWFNLTEKELENAIFSNFIKSAAESDKINFLILQKAYLSISQLFY